MDIEQDIYHAKIRLKAVNILVDNSHAKMFKICSRFQAFADLIAKFYSSRSQTYKRLGDGLILPFRLMFVSSNLLAS